MADLTQFKNKVEHAIEFGLTKQKQRPYLGYSGLGNPCMRKLWMDFRWCYTQSLEPRIQRLFNRGHAEENIIIADLYGAGMAVKNREAEVVGLAHHVLGHIDGEVLYVPDWPNHVLLLEMKTMKLSKFKEYLKVGLKKFSPTYWGQIHSYMGKRKLHACLYVVTCKDNEERDYKIIPFCQDTYDQMETVAVNVLTSEDIPDRIGKKTWYACKICSAKGTCHGGNEVNRNCRTCEYADIEELGKWSCSYYNESKNLTTAEQREGCVKYERLGCLDE
jgi:hypothetical protein